MEKFIHRENLALYKKCLEEPHTAAEREVLLKCWQRKSKKNVVRKSKKIDWACCARSSMCLA